MSICISNTIKGSDFSIRALLAHNILKQRIRYLLSLILYCLKSYHTSTHMTVDLYRSGRIPSVLTPSYRVDILRGPCWHVETARWALVSNWAVGLSIRQKGLAGAGKKYSVDDDGAAVKSSSKAGGILVLYLLESIRHVIIANVHFQLWVLNS
jgi:hypothetical protein